MCVCMHVCMCVHAAWVFVHAWCVQVWCACPCMASRVRYATVHSHMRAWHARCTLLARCWHNMQACMPETCMAIMHETGPSQPRGPKESAAMTTHKVILRNQPGRCLAAQWAMTTATSIMVNARHNDLIGGALKAEMSGSTCAQCCMGKPKLGE